MAEREIFTSVAPDLTPSIVGDLCHFLYLYGSIIKTSTVVLKSKTVETLKLNHKRMMARYYT